MAFATLRQSGVPAQGHPDALAVVRRKPHVCFVAPYAWPVLSRDPNIQVVGGAEVQQCVLARLLADNGYRVSMISFDYGQPSPTLVDGVTVYKSFRERAGIPVFRFLHPRLTTMWRVLREVDADVYYQRSSAMWTGVIAEFCRRYGKRAIYAGASDRDFDIGQEQIVLARDRWLYRRGLARVDRVVAQNPYQVESCRRNHKRNAVLIPSCYELPKDAKPGNGDRVLWYYADFGATGGPPTLSLKPTKQGCYTVHAFDDNGGTATVTGVQLHIGSRRTVNTTPDTAACPGPHPGLLVRATATGAVRSNAVK